MDSPVGMPRHPRTLARIQPSALLLAVQILGLALYAAFDASSAAQAVVSALVVLALPLTICAINHRPAVRWITWGFAIPTFALTLLSALVDSPTLVIWSSLLQATLYFCAVGNLIAYMMGDYRVTIDELFAVGATFTLLASGFSHACYACQTWSPGSFLGRAYPQQPRTFLELLSLSFANLSATGLSDILPVSPAARVLVMLQQLFGVLYLAMVVARLVGMTVARNRSKRAS